MELAETHDNTRRLLDSANNPLEQTQFLIDPSELHLGERAFFVGCWLLVVGCWLLVVGCWLLVVGCDCCFVWLLRCICTDARCSLLVACF
jgi:hypothetical protein